LLRDYTVPRDENKGVTKIEQSIAVRPPTFITGLTNPQQVFEYILIFNIIIGNRLTEYVQVLIIFILIDS